MTAAAAPLSADDVRMILAASGKVAMSVLEITETPAGVVVRGDPWERSAAFHVLFDAGLAVAPYPDRDEWKRKRL